MRYLATIGQKPVWGSQQLLHLHCKEVNKAEWVSVKDSLSLELPHKLQPGALVIAHITASNHRLQRLDVATDAIVAMLHEFTTIGRRYKDLASDISAWRESMEFQLQELRRREEELLQRAEELQVDLTCSLDHGHPEPAIPVSFESHQDALLRLEL
jgi:DNA repair ATPase RecN